MVLTRFVLKANEGFAEKGLLDENRLTDRLSFVPALHAKWNCSIKAAAEAWEY
jgi:hypothetical protein